MKLIYIFIIKFKMINRVKIRDMTSRNKSVLSDLTTKMIDELCYFTEMHDYDYFINNQLSSTVKACKGYEDRNLAQVAYDMSFVIQDEEQRNDFNHRVLYELNNNSQFFAPELFNRAWQSMTIVFNDFFIRNDVPEDVIIEMIKIFNGQPLDSAVFSNTVAR